MTSLTNAKYRLRLARGFLDEARQDLSLQRWRSCVDNGQLSIENSAKTILALYGPIAKTHRVVDLLKDLVEKKNLPAPLHQKLELSIPLFETFGFEKHVLTDYGNEDEMIDPWQLFDVNDAKKAFETAKSCLGVAEEIEASFESTQN